MAAERDEKERSADILDQANQASETFFNAEADRARAAAAPESHPDFDGKHCVEEDCGVKIPAPRRALGRIRCVDCQGRREALARRWL